MQVDRRDRGFRRPDERHQFLAAQYHPADMTVDAVIGVLEAETALEAQVSVLVATHSYSRRVYGLVQPHDLRCRARVTAQLLGVFRSGARRIPVGENGG